jgi:hypothetical protein
VDDTSTDGPLIHGTSIDDAPVDDTSVLDLRETRQVEDHVKTERRTCDNRDSRASSMHTVNVSHTIERTAVIDTSRALSVGGSAIAKIPAMSSVVAKVDASISRRYSVTARETIAVSETVTVNVPAHVAVEVIVDWIRVCQEGEAVVTTGLSSGVQLVIPFRLPAVLRFDTKTVEL